MTIDKSSYIPLSKQLEDIISDRIKRGKYRVGDKLPSQEMFVKEFGISRITVRQSMNNLIDRGVIESFKGKGTFVQCVPTVMDDYHTSSGLTAQFNQSRKELETIILSKKEIVSDSNLDDQLLLKPKTQLYAIERVRKLGGKVFSFEKNYLNIELIDYDDFLALITNNSSLYNTIRTYSNINIEFAEETLDIIISDEFIEKQIDIPPKTPLLLVKRRTFPQGKNVPFEFTEYIIKPEYYGKITYRNVL